VSSPLNAGLAFAQEQESVRQDRRANEGIESNGEIERRAESGGCRIINHEHGIFVLELVATVRVVARGLSEPLALNPVMSVG
jgi:hypothetical protein